MREQQKDDKVYIGCIKYMVVEKGFGYIRVPETREEFYFRTANLDEKINEGDFVRFQLQITRQGLLAIHLQLINDQHNQ
jgi:cold shock CspA family protein